MKTINDGSHKVALYWRCATDVKLFAQVYFSHYCKHPFNEFHREDFKSIRYGERSIRRARGAPRGYAKSTLKALIKPIHDVCYGLEKYIVIISNTSGQAAQKLKDIRTELLSNTSLVLDYRIGFSRKVPAETEFVVSAGDSQTMFSAFGSRAEIRGIRFGEARPSKIIVDDCEHSEEVFNEELRNKDADWYREVVSKIGDENTNIEFIGTVLHRDSLLIKVLNNPAYNSKLYKAIISWSDREDLWNKWREIYSNLDNENRLADSEMFYVEHSVEMLRGTKVLWPEKEPYLFLMKEMIEIGKRAFMKEKQNEPLGAEDKVFYTFQWYQERADGLFIERTQTLIPWAELRPNAYSVLDPSTGQTKARKGKLGDFACFLSGYTDRKNRLFVHEDWTKRAPPTHQIEQIFESHKRFEYQKVGIETNLYRDLLTDNIRAERARREKVEKKSIRLPLYDIENVDNKEKRIHTLEPKLTHGWILLNRNLSQTFKTQLEEFPHADHDDCPDALEMLWGLVNGRYKMSEVKIDPRAGR